MRPLRFIVPLLLLISSGHAFADETPELEKLRHDAEQGLVEAQFDLGVAYHQGIGVPRNDTEAVKWYHKAADQGDAIAQSTLGVMYAKGEGVPRDDTEAVKWFRKAADQGHAKAQYNLGVRYAKGEGVPRDYATAYMWMNLAAAQSDDMAKKGRDVLEGSATLDQVAEGQKMTREWMATHTK